MYWEIPTTFKVDALVGTCVRVLVQFVLVIRLVVSKESKRPRPLRVIRPISEAGENRGDKSM